MVPRQMARSVGIPAGKGNCMKGLTKQQVHILTFIETYIAKNRYSPTYREIMHHFSFSSSATVYKHIQALKKKGALLHLPKQARSVELVENHAQTSSPTIESEISFIGTLHADQGISLFPQTQTISIPPSFVDDKEKTYVLLVQGDGFGEEQLCDGDQLIVEGRTDVQNGEMVIALINAQVPLIKRYFLDESYVRLEGTQKDYQPIILHQKDVFIHGVIRGLLRYFSHRKERT